MYVDETDYAKFVQALSKDGGLIHEELSGKKCELLHMAMGVAGEAGELLDAIKKHTMYNRKLDLNNVVEELGDLEFYMQGIRNLLEITRKEIIEHNRFKLGVRYAEGKYSNEQANARADKC